MNPLALANEADDDPHFGVGINNLAYYHQGPGLERTARWGFSLEANYDLPVYNQILRPEIFMMFIPDNTKSLQTSVKISEDFWIFGATFAYRLDYFFRFSFGLGPSFILSHTQSKISGKSDSHLTWIFAPIFSTSIDYVITDHFEIRSLFSYVMRTSDDKSDWILGLGLGYNLE